MKRREFIELIGAAAIGSPVPVHSQPTDRVPRVGVLTGLSEDDPETKIRVEAFREGLRELGLQDRHNIHIDYRGGALTPDEAARKAKELIELNPDVIFAATNPAVAAFVRQTRTTPIVFVQVGDPVGEGFVASLARPGGNITGFTPYEFSLGGKWLEILKEIAPQLTQISLVFNPRYRSIRRFCPFGRGSRIIIGSARGPGASSQPFRDRGCHQGICSRSERRAHLVSRHFYRGSSQTHYRIGGRVPSAGSLWPPVLRYRRRAGGLWA
jgi:ABC transporter substrate binding protein